MIIECLSFYQAISFRRPLWLEKFVYIFSLDVAVFSEDNLSAHLRRIIYKSSDIVFLLSQQVDLLIGPETESGIRWDWI